MKTGPKFDDPDLEQQRLREIIPTIDESKLSQPEKIKLENQREEFRAISNNEFKKRDPLHFY